MKMFSHLLLHRPRFSPFLAFIFATTPRLQEIDGGRCETCCLCLAEAAANKRDKLRPRASTSPSSSSSTTEIDSVSGPALQQSVESGPPEPAPALPATSQSSSVEVAAGVDQYGVAFLEAAPSKKKKNHGKSTDGEATRPRDLDLLDGQHQHEDGLDLVLDPHLHLRVMNDQSVYFSDEAAEVLASSDEEGQQGRDQQQLPAAYVESGFLFMAGATTATSPRSSQQTASEGATTFASMCKNEICDFVRWKNPIAEQLRIANAELAAREFNRSGKISLQVLQGEVDHCEFQKQSLHDVPGAGIFSSADVQAALEAAAAGSGGASSRANNSTTSGRTIENKAQPSSVLCVIPKYYRSDRSDFSWVATVFPADVVRGDEDNSTARSHLVPARGDRDLLRPSSSSLRPMYNVASEGYEQEASTSMPDGIGIATGKPFLTVVDEVMARSLARKYLAVIKRSPVSNYATHGRAWWWWDQIGVRNPETTFDPPYLDEKYYSLAPSTLEAHSRLPPSAHSDPGWDFERSFDLYEEHGNATFLFPGPVISRAFELVRPRIEDLTFPRPWAIAGAAIYHVVSAILFTNAQLAGTLFLERKGIDFAGGERAQVGEAGKGYNKTADVRQNVVSAAPLSFKRGRCTGEGESVRMWDVAKEYALKNAGRVAHGWRGRLGGMVRQATTSAVTNLREDLGPGHMPVLVLADVVDVTHVAEMQSNVFRERFLWTSWAGFRRRLLNTEMHMLTRCEKWADRLNIRAILAVEDEDVEHVRNAVRAAVRLVAKSSSTRTQTQPITSAGTGSTGGGLAAAASASSLEQDSAKEGVAGAAMSHSAEVADEELELPNEPLKFVVMSVTEADSTLHLFENRGTKEWIEADVLASWYAKHAIDFAATASDK
ncbi:unnamed protein product [Amoebophrya sp. A120]|nr:unnamed protein product [Amoebophrya sp. A120]|eukprot:GSA120T00018254001.1